MNKPLIILLTLVILGVTADHLTTIAVMTHPPYASPSGSIIDPSLFESNPLVLTLGLPLWTLIDYLILIFFVLTMYLFDFLLTRYIPRLHPIIYVFPSITAFLRIAVSVNNLLVYLSLP